MGGHGAVYQAAENRFRPIPMTLCSFSLLVFLPGEGTEPYHGVGAIVLLGTAIVTATFLPALTVAVLSCKTK